MGDHGNKRRVTKEQKIFLVDYLEEHREFAHDRFVNDAGVHSLAEQWAALTSTINAMGGALKDSEGWKRAWINMRSKTKQKAQDAKNARERTGNTGPEVVLSELDERIINIMSPLAVVGLLGVSEPLRSSSVIPPTDISEIEYLDDEYIASTEPSAPMNTPSDPTNDAQQEVIDEIPVPLITSRRPSKRKLSSVNINEKFLELEEKKLRIAEAVLEEKRKKNEISRQMLEEEKKRNIILGEQIAAINNLAESVKILQR